MRALGRIHEMRAERLTGDALLEALAPIVLHKYLGIAVDSARWLPEQNTGCIFRLEPRS